MRVIVGGVGYRNLCDCSFGPMVSDALSGRDWPDGVSVEDLSYNPIAVVQRLEDDPVDRRFDRAVLVGAATREGRAPGTLSVYRWDGVLPPADRIQAAVAEAVTGVIALDNTVMVAAHFGAWPPQVVIVEIEPAFEQFGDELSPQVAPALASACELVTRLALEPAVGSTLPVAALGGQLGRVGR